MLATIAPFPFQWKEAFPCFARNGEGLWTLDAEDVIIPRRLARVGNWGGRRLAECV